MLLTSNRLTNRYGYLRPSGMLADLHASSSHGLSGPKRYDYTESDAKWRYSRDGQGLTELLNDELGRVFNERLQLLSSKS